MDAKTLGESDLLSSVIGLLEIPHSPYLLPPWSFLFALTLSPEAKIAHEKREAFRIKLLQLTENALKAKPQNGEEPTFRQELRSMRDYLKGSAAAGKLLGNPAPEIAFQWTKPSRFEKLSHLKGKIVLVNFWTTWAPYKQSFEMLRRLQERYREAKVVILGVTSLQGTHFNIQEDKRLDTKGRPQWERTLMQRFMREMGITWQVAFATGEVFQPDYGVRDLPHFTLLDPAGRVRLNAPLHPKLESEITTQIESLLKESPRPAPK
jgi:thiol-disulfide isomerase/thioredoxin